MKYFETTFEDYLQECYDTNFSKTDMVILEGVYSDEKNIDGSYIHPEHINELTNYVQSLESNVNTFTGTINVANGKIVESDITILHSRSIAEDISVKLNSTKDLYSGLLTINNGKINERVSLEGKSLVYRLNFCLPGSYFIMP